MATLIIYAYFTKRPNMCNIKFFKNFIIFSHHLLTYDIYWLYIYIYIADLTNISFLSKYLDSQLLIHLNYIPYASQFLYLFLNLIYSIIFVPKELKRKFSFTIISVMLYYKYSPIDLMMDNIYNSREGLKNLAQW